MFSVDDTEEKGVETRELAKIWKKHGESTMIDRLKEVKTGFPNWNSRGLLNCTTLIRIWP